MSFIHRIFGSSKTGSASNTDSQERPSNSSPSQAKRLDTDKVLVVGLGNPGAEYERTRHNVGFLVAQDLASPFKNERKHKALGSRTRIGSRAIDVLMPQTFMNLSGEAVQSYTQFHNIEPAGVIVVHDEADLPFGEIRVKFGGGNAGHNGLKSIQKMLGTGDFWRVRVGIGRPPHPNMPLDAHVLGRWSNEESEALPSLIQHASQAIRELISS